jgi:uncharacterized protein YbjT (DUF2867 family)
MDATSRMSLLAPGEQRVLVTGATGYIGGRLVPRLLSGGHHVRCVAREPSRLAGRDWAGVEIVPGDLSDPAVLPAVLDGVDVAYYLVHSMAEGAQFRERDRAMARAFGLAAATAGVKRIVYLGGLGRTEEVHSRHLVSRQEVGRMLAGAGVPVVEFRAAVIVGSGSASFEMIRHLVERLPFMVTPKWVDTRCQPIGVRDVLDHLVLALERPDAEGVFEIGGRDILSYREMMLHYATVRGLRRKIVALPVPRPQLSGLFVGLVTPIPYRIAHPLIQSLRTEVTVCDTRAREVFGLEPMGYDEAVERAVARLDADDVATTWASSLASLGHGVIEGRELSAHEGMLFERHRARVAAHPTRVFEVISALGGEAGWPAGNWLWQLRGAMDRLCGGVGMRRGRRNPRELLAGDPVDFWRVEAVEGPHVLRLRAEMKLPGRAWLQFEVLPDAVGSRVEQTAFYDPHGTLGYAYWYAVRPFHRFVFPGLLSAVKERAELAEQADRARSAA